VTRINTLLVIALVASSLYLVRTAYDARRLYTELDRAKNESARLEVEYKRLEAERQAAATNARVERSARERLAMRTATPAVTVYVQDAAASGASQ
jgi:cell division protein FtsL